MGGAASSSGGPSSPQKGMRDAESLQVSGKQHNSGNKKSLKVPLHIALRAIVIIQKRARMRIARKKLLRLIAIKEAEDAAARKYLNQLREQLEQAKLSPVKQSKNRFASSLSIFNRFDALETVGGDSVSLDDYFDANKLSASSVLIYPSLGFVIKSKTVDIGRKVFVNITHHELVAATNNANMRYTSPRLLVNSSVSEEGVYEVSFENVLVFDVLISSIEFNESFVYKAGMGVVPVSAKAKNKYAEMAIHFLNSFEHSYNLSHPYYHNNSTKTNTISNSASPGNSSNNNRRSKKNTAKAQAATSSLDEAVSDFKISLSYKFPKIKRNYVGEVTPMVFQLDSSLMLPVYYKHNGNHSSSGSKTNTSQHDSTNRSTLQLNPPPLLRNWLVLPTERQQQLLLASKRGGDGQFSREVTFMNQHSRSNSFDDLAAEAKHSEEQQQHSSLIVLTGHRRDIPYFNTTQNHRHDPHDPRSLTANEDGKNDLEESHVKYFRRLNDLLTGVVAYVVVNHGVLTLYYHTNASKRSSSSSEDKKSSSLLNPSPFGHQEYMKVLLFNYHLAVSVDNVNNIFYLQLLSNAPSPLDTYSMLFNMYDSVNDEVILQFKSYSELLAWKLYLTAHIEYSERTLRLVGQNNRGTTINSFPACGIPESVSVWTTRVRSGSGNNVLGGLNYISTTKVFLVIAMGLLKIFSDESCSESTLIDCMSLQQVSVLVRKGAMVNRASRTCDVLVSLMRDHYLDEECVTDIIAEFIFYAAPPDDPAVEATVQGLYKHIHFASHHAYSYMIPILEYNHKLSLDHKDIKLTTVTVDVAKLVDGSAGVGINEEQEEEEEVNSDDDVTVSQPVRRKSNFGRKEFLIKEEVFRCIGTTKDYKSRTDLNKFPSTLTASLHSKTNSVNNTYSLLLCEDKLLIYQNLCFVAAVNVSQANIELVTPPVDAGVKRREEQEEGVVPEVVYDAWQITLVASNSLKYRIRFPNESQYLTWLQLIDKNCECAEHKKVAPPSPTPEEVDNTMQLSDDDEDELNMLRERNRSNSKEDALSAPKGTSPNDNIKTALSLSLFQSKQNIRGNNPADSVERNIDNNATKKYFRLLRDNEKVLACGLVQKFEPKPKGAFAAPSAKRMLLLTDVPRLMYLDPISNIVRGHVELQSGLKIEYKHTSLSDWDITVAGVVTKFSVCDDKDAKFWTHKLKVAVVK